jgi:hypothetical protein
MTPSPTQIAPRSPAAFPAGAAIFRLMFTRLGCGGRPPHFRVVFYPYASLSHTIRLRGEEVDARLSDLMRGAPVEALEAAAAILLSKLYRLRLPPAFEVSYRKYADSARLLSRLDRARRRRGRRKHMGPKGQTHDLLGVFDRVNREYFSGGLPATDLGWSTQTWKRQLGVFDPGMRHIVINRWLDRPNVPEHVVAYVVYHEMLHLERSELAARGTRNGNSTSVSRKSAPGDRCRMGLHTPEFRRAERRYREFAQARSFLLRAGRW